MYTARTATPVEWLLSTRQLIIQKFWPASTVYRIPLPAWDVLYPINGGFYADSALCVHLVFYSIEPPICTGHTYIPARLPVPLHL
ncbi:hypothetical protein I7I50_09879 [Histoplasma capsulatum G186AR]|uniref:Uncharacterized protein n=1 Tax=Ajellomyces capsulatus TaxID=5037 RepID=A0A8H8D687_AJECA|nr:hypothetical protein I7I52_01117 [Histoplasma capsulatum]QSS68794.1 hypothetical protein I7I50_09879 [Histoplasma capsulatum G186AR]